MQNFARMPETSQDLGPYDLEPEGSSLCIIMIDETFAPMPRVPQLTVSQVLVGMSQLRVEQ